jgi:hypothetical protein
MSNSITSRTYKLRAPSITEHAIYFTVAGDPIEALFINSKEMESFQWITFCMTQITRRLRDGVDICLVIDDMKKTFDPGGAYIVPDGSGVKVNSLVHHLGIVLEKHLRVMDKVMSPNE